MTLLSLLLAAVLSAPASAASLPGPAAVGKISAKQVSAQFADKILSADEQAAQNADCPPEAESDANHCYWTGPEDDPRQWMISGASFASLTIDLQTRELTYTRDLAGKDRPGSHREARFVLDPVDIEGLALLAPSGDKLIRLPEDLRKRLWALAQVAEQRGQDTPRRGRVTRTR